MEISEPSALTKLPKPLTENGRTYFSQVHGIRNGLKRKREELCVGIDGDSINIYDELDLPSTAVRLYIILSTMRFALNIYYRRNETSLSVYKEEVNGSDQKPKAKNLILEDNTVPVIQLEVLPGNDTHHLLALRENGQFEIYSEDLSSRVQQGKLYGTRDNVQFVAALWLSSAQARKTILKARPDIIASSDANDSFILGIITSEDTSASMNVQGVEYGVWQVLELGKKLSNDLPCQAVFTHKLSTSSPLLSRERDPVTFAVKDTRLILKTQAKVVAFDIALTTPRLIQETSPVADHLSSIFISDALSLTSTSASLQLFNTQFRTLQTKLDLNKPGLKRKRAQDPRGPIIFSIYFPTSSRVIATRRNHLIAIDLRVRNSDDFSTAAKQLSLLISNIGRGATSQERLKSSERISKSLVGRTYKQHEYVEQWHATTSKLEQCIQDKEYAKFEEICLDHGMGKITISTKESPVVTNYKFDYVISKLFEYEPVTDDASNLGSRRLRLAFPAPQLLEMLALRGLLTPERIGKVLRASLRSNFEPIKYGDISRIIMDSDLSLDLFRNCLAVAPFWAYQELCAAVQILLRRALAETKSSLSTSLGGKPRLLTETESIGVATALANQPASVSGSVTACLCDTINRLSETEKHSLSRFLRQSFNQEELIALIQFLRQQLFRSGYTRSTQAHLHPNPPISESGFSSQKLLAGHDKTVITLDAIAITLSSCIDAIGPIGILSFGDDDEFVQTLIPELSSEVSKAAEAIQEAVYLKGILRETLRFIESTTQSQANGQTNENSAMDSQPKPGTIVTLYSKSTTDKNFDQSPAVLPLGLRTEGTISKIKIRKGDGKTSRRSAREMGMQQDRQRGPYAFERLVL